MIFTAENEGTTNESVNFKMIEVDEEWIVKYFVKLKSFYSKTFSIIVDCCLKYFIKRYNYM